MSLTIKSKQQPMNPLPWLETRHISYLRQQTFIFQHLSFQVARQQILFITGANGAGKTSLLKLLVGFSYPYQGEILWQGTSIYHCRNTYQENIHYLGHQNGHQTGLTVAENLQLFKSLSCSQFTDQVHTLLADLNLLAFKDTLVRCLSAGQARKLALVKLFMSHKPLWILDEPLTALDKDTQQFFTRKLIYHIQQGGACIVSSHHVFELGQINVQTIRLGNDKNTLANILS